MSSLVSAQVAAPRSPAAWEITSTVSTCALRDASPPRKSPMPQEAAPRSARAAKPNASVADRPRCGGRVELVRVVEDDRLRRAARRAVVVRCDRVQELGPEGGIEAAGPLVDQPHPELEVAEQCALLGRPEGRTAAELAYAA